jgi:hypothetical protein
LQCDSGRIRKPTPITSAQLYQTYRPIGRGTSIATTSEPDTRRVPDISAAYADLATNSTPDLQLALAGIRAEGKRHGFGGRCEPASIPEDVQVGQQLRCFNLKQA